MFVALFYCQCDWFSIVPPLLSWSVHIGLSKAYLIC